MANPTATEQAAAQWSNAVDQFSRALSHVSQTSCSAVLFNSYSTSTQWAIKTYEQRISGAILNNSGLSQAFTQA